VSSQRIRVAGLQGKSRRRQVERSEGRVEFDGGFQPTEGGLRLAGPGGNGGARQDEIEGVRSRPRAKGRNQQAGAQRHGQLQNRSVGGPPGGHGDRRL
jgi:hypothetical protein